MIIFHGTCTAAAIVNNAYNTPTCSVRHSLLTSVTVQNGRLLLLSEACNERLRNAQHCSRLIVLASDNASQLLLP